LRDTEHEITQNERLARAFIANGRFIPHFLGVTGIGFLAIYILTRMGIFGEPSDSLIFIGGSTILLALVQVTLLALARRNKGVAASLWGTLSTAVFTILLTFFWQGVFPLTIAVALIPPISTVRAGISRRYYPVLALTTVLSIVGILFTESRSTFDRLQTGTPASIASIVFLIAASLLLATISIISENKNFKKLRSLLLTSFIIIVMIPTIMAATLSAIGTFTNNQTQTFDTLRTISNLKKNQLDALIRDYQNDAGKLQNDSGFTLNALNVLTAEDNDLLFVQNSKRVARDRMETILGGAGDYTEVMVLNTQGDALISTLPENEGLNFESQLFFRQGTLRRHTGFAESPSFGGENLIVATPIFDAGGRVIRGVLVLRSNAHSIKSVMESTPGFDEAETYLVNRSYQPVTNTRTAVDTISTQASLEAILNNVTGGQAIYENYEKQTVLGYYEWFEPMQVAMISEVPLSIVVFNSTRALVGSAVLALFIISMAIAAVAISAHSIVNPITVLAQTTESFAAGKLSARAPIQRQDEIGALAKSYNQMAAQLQEIIGRLEQRVNDRTQELENQTTRLRIAAEVVRDAAFARGIDELLERSVHLIADRFNFRHTGIYLLDKNQEFCILVASSSEEGKNLIASSHRIRVGEAGVVGRVAATSEARISHATEADGRLFSLSDSLGIRSEVALPLTADRNVIGVLDMLLTVVVIVAMLLALAGLSLDEAAFRAIMVATLVFAIVVLPTATETASHGRSLGKLVMGLRVVRDDGGGTGFRHAFIRALTGVVEIYLTFGGLAVLVGFLNPSSKRLGDILAGTHAQVERVPKVPSAAFGVPPELVAWAATADVARLPDPLARRVASFFSNVHHLVPESRARLARSLAAEVAPFVSPLPADDPERFLAAVVALRRDRDLTALRLEDARMASLAPVLTATPVGFPDR
jgi:uncharacterized RDD family membrane protein YckC/HAMP domain-containing protein